MSWLDNLQRVTYNGRVLVGASFRGVPFLVEESERGGGRRAVIHEFPYADDPFGEDLGRKARSFKMTGYVLGDTYTADRDALLAAIEDVEGPGTLVHPYYGTKIAICLTYSINEKKTDGRIATFTLEFAETPAQTPQPSTAVDSADQVSDSADTANDACDTEFQSQYNPSVPGFALASAQTALGGALAQLKSQLSPIVSATQEAAQLSSAIAIMTAQASALVTEPALIVSQFRTAITNLQTTIGSSPAAVMNALIAAYGAANFGPTVIATTPTRTQELANQTALVAALQRVFAIEAARLAPTVTYASIEDAISTRDQLVAIFDAQVATAGDVAYPALVDLRSQVMLAVPGSNLFPTIVTVTRNVAVPSLLLAYQLYGSIDLEADVIARNDIPNPSFVAGELEVLSSAT